MEISDLRSAVSAGRISWRQHTLKRMLERNIPRKNVIDVIGYGEIIEEYPLARPCPSCLILGLSDNVVYHVVVAYDLSEKMVYVITVYEPDESHFMADFKTRKKDK